MRILIAAVGRDRAGPTRDLVALYRDRLTWPFELMEVDVKRKLPPDRLPDAEAALLLATLPTGCIRVALDGSGHQLSSRKLAERLAAWRDGGVRDVAFLIGGADGHGSAVLDSAALVLSLGAMTWPHLLVRGMVLEQIYRAQCILAGHPYHRD